MPTQYHQPRAQRAPASSGRPGPRLSRPILLLVILVILAITVGHTLLWATVPLLWIAFLVAAVLFVTGRLRRPSPRQDR
jgi:Flp pilus assembly protein TadB